MNLINKKINFTLLLLISLALTLFACGDNSRSDKTDVKINSKISINAKNAQELTGLSYNLAVSMKSITNILGMDTTVVANVSDVAINQADGRKIIKCVNGGTAEIPVLGAIGEYIYNNCELQGTLFNGSAIVKGTGTRQNFNGTLELVNLSNAIPTRKVTANGTLNLTYVSNAGNSTYKISSQSILLSESNKQVTLENLNITTNVDTAVKVETFTVKYSLAVKNKIFSGSLDVESTLPFKTTLGKSYPYDGNLLIKGANGTKSFLLVNSGVGDLNDKVTIEIDETGKGYDAKLNITLPWSSL